MVIDSSGLIGIFYREIDHDVTAMKMARAPVRVMSAATFVESYIFVTRRSGEAGGRRLKSMVLALGIEVVAFTPLQAELAQEAYLRYGKGLHPAGLNLGDCFSYALAKSLGEPLLFKGSDLGLTDVVIA